MILYIERKRKRERGRDGERKKVGNAHILEKKLLSNLKCRSLILDNRKQFF